jgi:hypothetical protein
LRLFCKNGPRRSGREHVGTDDELLSDLQQYHMNICVHCSRSIFSIDQNRDSYGGTFISSCKHLVCHSCLPQCYKRKRIACFAREVMYQWDLLIIVYRLCIVQARTEICSRASQIVSVKTSSTFEWSPGRTDE